MIIRRTTAGLALILASAGALVACKGETHYGPTTIVTVTAGATGAPSSGSATPSGTSGASSSATSSPASGAGPAPTGMTKLPGRCETLLASPAITDAISQTIPGKTAFVVGTPDKTTGRLGYINCRYGIGKNPDNPGLEIGVSLYKTAGQAGARIPLTVTDFENNSGSAAKTAVDGIPAYYITGGQSAGYGPSVVLSYGQRTFAVTFRDGVVPAAEVKAHLIAVTKLAIERTAPR